MLINELRLSLPTFNLKDWEAAVESASGAMQNILTAQTEGVRLLAAIQEPVASTERIGWLNLWSKVFAALEAVTAALTQRSKLVLLLSQRTSFELMLQAHAVIDPLRKLSEENDGSSTTNEKEFAFRSCVDRLRAYTAWCLWHDKAYFKEVLNPKSMRDIWNLGLDHGAQDVNKSPAMISQVIETGEIGALDENFLRVGSRNVRKLYTDKIRQIEEWLADPFLRKWVDGIEQASRKNIVGVPFFTLFDHADISIPKRLLREGIRFTYSAYIMSSMASHASSMEEFIQIENNSLKPLLSGDEEELKTLSSEVILRCRHIYTILNILNKEMVQRPHIRS
jgi:hypothetical protein